MNSVQELNKTFEVDGCEFVVDMSPGYNRRPSEKNSFTIVKSPQVLQYYFNLAKRLKASRILEVGVFQGGSFVLLDKLFKPKTLIGVEIAKSFQSLNDYCGEQVRNVNVYFETSQTDETALSSILDVEFSSGIDLVVDDASHTYENTRKTFELVFPRLDVGGTYIIEDWAWAHVNNENHVWYKEPAMTNLLFELIIEMGASNNIRSVSIDKGKAVIVKGGSRDLLSGKGLRGRKLEKI